MDVNLLVDWVVVIWGSLILITLIVAIILGFLFYRQIKALSKSTKDTIDTAKQLGSDVGQTLKTSKDILAIFKSAKAGSGSPVAAGSNTKDGKVI